MKQEYGIATPGPQAQTRSPRVLVANDQEIWIWSLETILVPEGFSVIRATSAEQVLEQVQAAAPDVLVLHSTLRDSHSVDLCRDLRKRQLIGPTTPIIITTSGPCRRSDRLEVLKAGGWEYASLPLDGEELVAKLRIYMAAKLTSDRAYAEGLIDPASGFYDIRGILLRVRELGLAAQRHGRALGCATISCDESTTPAHEPTSAFPTEAVLCRPLASRAPELLRSVVRGSDILGRLAPSEFVILAPETELPGMLQLAQRLVESFEAEALVTGSTSPVRVGCYAVPDFASVHLEPMEMIVRATQALRLAQLPGSKPIQPFPGDGAD